MSKIAKPLLNAVSKVIKIKININRAEAWPNPPCMGILYQPKRPTKNETQQDENLIATKD